MHHREPDRAFDADFQIADAERSGQHALDPFGGLECVLDPFSQGHEHSELVAAGAGEHVAGAER